MKDKFIITISDIHGSKQYTVSQFLKTMFFWILIVAVIAFAIVAMGLKYLSSHVESLEKDKKELVTQKKILIKQIIQTQENYDAIKEQLQEAKNLIGLEENLKSDENKKAQKQEEQEEQNKEEDISKNSQKLTKLEYTLLTRLIPTVKPLEYKRISTKFGMRIHPVTRRKQFHSALDLTADIGTPIYAPADGVVVYAGKKRFYGNFLLIRHGLGFATAYGHLHRIGVKSGDYVKKGDLVALSGNTGRSTGPHLHYEIRYLSRWLDPEVFIKKWSYKTYDEVMKKNSHVKWKEMIKQIRDNIKTIKNFKKLENKGE